MANSLSKRKYQKCETQVLDEKNIYFYTKKLLNINFSEDSIKLYIFGISIVPAFRNLFLL